MEEDPHSQGRNLKNGIGYKQTRDLVPRVMRGIYLYVFNRKGKGLQGRVPSHIWNNAHGCLRPDHQRHQYKNDASIISPACLEKQATMQDVLLSNFVDARWSTTDLKRWSRQIDSRDQTTSVVSWGLKRVCPKREVKKEALDRFERGRAYEDRVVLEAFYKKCSPVVSNCNLLPQPSQKQMQI